jgi:hypothetical protein
MAGVCSPGPLCTSITKAMVLTSTGSGPQAGLWAASFSSPIAGTRGSIAGTEERARGGDVRERQVDALAAEQDVVLSVDRRRCLQGRAGKEIRYA